MALQLDPPLQGGSSTTLQRPQVNGAPYLHGYILEPGPQQTDGEDRARQLVVVAVHLAKFPRQSQDPVSLAHVATAPMAHDPQALLYIHGRLGLAHPQPQLVALLPPRPQGRPTSLPLVTLPVPLSVAASTYLVLAVLPSLRWALQERRPPRPALQAAPHLSTPPFKRRMLASA